jgi:hypothetical protein
LKTFAVTATAIGKIPRGLFNRLYYREKSGVSISEQSMLPSVIERRALKSASDFFSFVVVWTSVPILCAAYHPVE